MSNYTFKTSNSDVGRVVRYVTSPFMRSGVYDIYPDGLDYVDYGNNYAQTYDANTGKVFVGTNAIHDDIDGTTKTLKVVVLTDNPFGYSNEIVLSTGAYATENVKNIEAMCSFCDSGFVYVFTWNSNTSTGTIYEISTTSETVTRTATIAEGDQPVFQRNGMWVDSVRGYIYWSAKDDEKINGGDFIVGFKISTMAIDKVSERITSHHWGIAGCAIDKCAGVIYATHPIGPTYYPTHYALTSLNLDTLAIIETIELDDPTIIYTWGVEVTGTHVYLLGQAATGTNNYCLVTCTRSPLAEIDRLMLVSDGAVIQEGHDITLSDHDHSLLLTSRGYLSADYSDLAIDQRYSISSGIPVLSSENQEADPDTKETGDSSNLITCGEYFKSY